MSAKEKMEKAIKGFLGSKPVEAEGNLQHPFFALPHEVRKGLLDADREFPSRERTWYGLLPKSGERFLFRSGYGPEQVKAIAVQYEVLCKAKIPCRLFQQCDPSNAMVQILGAGFHRDFRAILVVSECDAPASFLYWLLNQRERDDPIGDLSRDLQYDPIISTAAHLSSSDLYVHVKSLGGGTAALRSVEDAAIEYGEPISRQKIEQQEEQSLIAREDEEEEEEEDDMYKLMKAGTKRVGSSPDDSESSNKRKK